MFLARGSEQMPCQSNFRITKNKPEKIKENKACVLTAICLTSLNPNQIVVPLVEYNEESLTLTDDGILLGR